MEADRTRTLVVTLDPALIQQIRTALEERGGVVSACPTADGAVDEITTRTYGLVVISAELPDQDGFELTSLLKELDPQIKVMLVGDDRDGRSIERSVEAGAEGFMHRPVRAAELLARFQDTMGTTWFDLDAEMAKSLPRHAESVVDPRTSLFPAADTGFDLSVQEEDGLAALSEDLGPAAAEEEGDGASDDDDSFYSDDVDSSSDDLAASDHSAELDDSARSSGERPEPSGHVVSAPFIQAPPTSTQELPPLAIEEFDEDNPVSIPVGADITAHGMTPVRPPSVLGPETGEYGTISPAEAIEQRIDRMLEPEGKLTKAIEDAVGSAVAKALAEQLPAVLQALKSDPK